jgi:hypothetical protein
MSIFRRHRTAGDPTEPPLRCSFCNKAQTDVQKLIAGPKVFICDECIGVCNDIIAYDASIERPPTAATPVEPTTRIVTCSLCGMSLPWEEAVPVPERGALCPGCTGAIEAALAEKDGREN